MKRLCSLILILGVLAALTVPALADVIWEPADDYFYDHRDEITYEEAQYEAARDTSFYASPEASPGKAIPAESVLWINYLLGEDWGSGYLFSEEEGYTEGWVRMEDFKKLYGKTDFEQDHRKEFTPREGTVPVTAEAMTYVWTFPGSGIVAGSFGGADNWIPEDDGMGYGTVYTDEAGQEWGEVGYYYGARGWVCISDPHNDALPRTAPKYADGTDAPAEAPVPTGAPSPAETPASTEAPASPAPAETGGFPALPVVIVAAAIVVTVVLLLLLRKKGGSKEA